MLRLASETEPGWVAAVERDLPTFLLDHAHCEKKAASTAINLIFRYQMHPELMVPLSELAREELEHFEQVLGILRARGWAFEPLGPSPYAAGLFKAIRKTEPGRLMDTMLVCALIEARSCERMRLLAQELRDAELADYYRSLLASEARHHALYVDLTLQRYGREATLARLSELAAHEAAVLEAMPPEARVHSRAPHSSK
jgi:tRNA-(ms[2]io[6]A)-hydroxylase